MPDPATIAAIIGFASALFSGGGDNQIMEELQRQRDEARRLGLATAKFDLDIATLESRRSRDLSQLSFEEKTAKLQARLSTISIKRQASIAASQQRSAAQKARIGGVGGSFAQTSRGVSEIRAEVDQQLFKLEVEKKASAEARELKRISIEEETEIGKGQAGLSAAGTVFDIQIGGAPADTSGERVRRVSAATAELLSTPEIAEALNSFFNDK